MKVKTITRTAVLLALTVVFQFIGRTALAPAVNNYVVGPLVNTCLLVAAVYAGFFPGVLISLLAPVGAVLTGAAVPLAFVPFIGVGNAILVAGFKIFDKKGVSASVRRVRYITGIILGAAVKAAFLALSIRITINLGWLGDIPAKKAEALTTTFSLPQLFTALLGGVVALTVIEALNRINSGKKE